MTRLRTLDEAKTEVIALIRTATGTPYDHKITVELWYDGDLAKAPPCVGVRVSELSFTHQIDGGGLCGSSVMQCEPLHIGILAAVERCIIERMVDTSYDGHDEIADADWRLRELLKE